MASCSTDPLSGPLTGLADRSCPATHSTQSSASSDLPSSTPSSKTSPEKSSSAHLQLPAPASCSVPGSSSDPIASFGFLTSLFISSSHHDPLTSCATAKITSLLPVPGQEALLSFAQRWLQPVPGTLPTGWFPKQAYLSCAKRKPIHPATLSTTLLYPSFLQQVAAPPLPLHLSKLLPSP